MKKLVIRAATPGDGAALASLNAEVQRLHATHRPDDFNLPSVDALEAWFAELLENESATVWIAEHDGAALGYVVVQVRNTPESIFCKARSWWELDAVGVAAEHRRSGVCRALFQKVLTEARTQGIADLELQTWAFNQDAHDAFRRLGFVPKRVRYELRIDSDDAAEQMP